MRWACRTSSDRGARSAARIWSATAATTSLPARGVTTRRWRSRSATATVSWDALTSTTSEGASCGGIARAPTRSTGSLTSATPRARRSSAGAALRGSGTTATARSCARPRSRSPTPPTTRSAPSPRLRTRTRPRRRRASPWCISRGTSSPARARRTWRATLPRGPRTRSAPAASCATPSTPRSCLANTSSYAECALAAVNLGDDTDTTAAVAGALAGIVYGIEGIPAEWLDALRGKDVIEACLF